MKPLNIAIIGCRGVPNHYGGFEQLAEHLSAGLVQKGHRVTVYNSHNHPNQAACWKNVTIVHRFDPEYLMGTGGQFLYDFNCIRHARKQHFDVWLLLGYTSSSAWGWLYPKKTVCISNMDGLEWKREKYGPVSRRFLLFAERLAVRFSHFFIADSPVIQSYLAKKYGIDPEYIEYGAEIPATENNNILSKLELLPDEYLLLIARMEPENNIGMILDGFNRSSTGRKFIVVGNTNNPFGRSLVKKFKADDRVVFTDSIFDTGQLHSLKKNCNLYFHGHSVGGTNPSLLEAMASGALVCAHENPFNRAVLSDNGYYFSSATDVKSLIDQTSKNGKEYKMIANNLVKIKSTFNWTRVIDQYERFIVKCYHAFQK